MITRVSGAPKFKALLKAASTAYAIGDTITPDGSGQFIPGGTAITTPIIGICAKEVTAASSDYASETLFEVDVNLTPDAEFEIDADGTVTDAMVGTYRDLATASTMETAAATHNHLFVLRHGSTTTKAIVRINTQNFA